MSDTPMTESQGDKIIKLLQDILWELKKLETNVDRIDTHVTRIKINSDSRS